MEISNFNLVILILVVLIVIFAYGQVKDMICSKEGFQTTITPTVTNVANSLTVSGDIKAIGKIATGTGGTTTKAYINNKGQGYFSGRVDVSSDIFVRKNPISRNYVTGTLSYSGSDNSTTYQEITVTPTYTSPHITISGNLIRFKYPLIYKIEGNFTVSGYNGCGKGDTCDGYLKFGDTSGNLPVIYNQLASSQSDDNDETVNHMGYYKGKQNNDYEAYTNSNYFSYLISPTVNVDYLFSTLKHKISSGNFVIYAVS